MDAEARAERNHQRIMAAFDEIDVHLRRCKWVLNIALGLLAVKFALMFI